MSLSTGILKHIFKSNKEDIEKKFKENYIFIIKSIEYKENSINGKMINFKLYDGEKLTDRLFLAKYNNQIYYEDEKVVIKDIKLKKIRDSSFYACKITKFINNDDNLKHLQHQFIFKNDNILLSKNSIIKDVIKGN